MSSFTLAFSTSFQRKLNICGCQCFCLKNEANVAELQALGQNDRCLIHNERSYAALNTQVSERSAKKLRLI